MRISFQLNPLSFVVVPLALIGVGYVLGQNPEALEAEKLSSVSAKQTVFTQLEQVRTQSENDLAVSRYQSPNCIPMDRLDVNLQYGATDGSIMCAQDGMTARVQGGLLTDLARTNDQTVVGQFFLSNPLADIQY